MKSLVLRGESLSPLLYFALFVCVSCTNIKLPAIFSDNMVLQQKTQVAVWGWTKPNTQVRVSGSWDEKCYTVKSNANGCWRVYIETPEAGFTPYQLTVSNGKTKTFKNILIGEVWVCSGQSNMEMPMKGFRDAPVEGGRETIAASANANIRCFSVKKTSKATPQNDCKGAWKMAGPKTTPYFTATGYFFARLLNRELNVPVGLIHASQGGSRIESWMTPNALKKNSGKPVVLSDTEDHSPSTLYNGMIYPIQGYGIRGVLWYQGESNRNEPALYVHLFDAMVRGWRDLWGVGEFPFYYCQLAPFNYDEGMNLAYFREAQMKNMTTTPNTGMAVLMDAESAHHIHPANKRDVGERLARWALAKTYGMEGIPYRSPELKSFEIEEQKVVLTFDIAPCPGLTTHDKEIHHFLIAGEDKQFFPAQADYSGNKVYVFSPDVDRPVAVRYCWDNASGTELFGVEGDLPVSSFRTDNW